MNPILDVITLTVNPTLDVTVTIDDFTPGEVNRATHTRSNPGGKGINVAAALADFGHSTAVTGFLGKENCSSFDNLFQTKKIQDHFIRSDNSVRSAIKIIDPIRHETTDINFPGYDPGSAAVKQLYEILSSLKATWAVLGGSLPTGLPETLYHDLTLFLKARGFRVAVDSSGEALRNAILACPQLIKPNRSELEKLIGQALPTTESIIHAARSLVEQGIEQVIVSMGAQGACFVSSNQTFIASPPVIPIASTVGAGDTMLAGWISAQLSGLATESAACRATAFSLSALSHEGAGLSSPEAVHAFMAEISISNS
jgi:1-phosphofructokinase